MSRTPGLIEEKIMIAEDAYLKGASNEMVADCLGIASSTLYYYINNGVRDLENGDVDSIYARFLTATKKARYKYEMGQCKLIEIAAEEPKNWTARAWLLERRNPRSFGRNSEELRQSKLLEEKIAEVQQMLNDKIGSVDDLS